MQYTMYGEVAVQDCAGLQWADAAHGACSVDRQLTCTHAFMPNNLRTCCVPIRAPGCEAAAGTSVMKVSAAQVPAAAGGCMLSLHALCADIDASFSST
jgi:hypothetical protein